MTMVQDTEASGRDASRATLFDPDALANPSKGLSFIGRWYAITQPEPPIRQQMYAEGASRGWLEWHWARGLDPFAIKKRGRRIADHLRRLVIERDGYVCKLCGDPVEPHDIHIDHVYPVALGGRDEPENLQVAHSFCNISKGARISWRKM